MKIITDLSDKWVQNISNKKETKYKKLKEGVSWLL